MRVAAAWRFLPIFLKRVYSKLDAEHISSVCPIPSCYFHIFHRSRFFEYSIQSCISNLFRRDAYHTPVPSALADNHSSAFSRASLL